jgi:hypothetical protein
MQSSLLQTLTQFGNILQGWLLPRLEEELGSLTAKQEQLVRVLGLLGMDGWIAPRRGRVGRPRRDRVAIARAFVAKAVYNLPSTRALREQLKSDCALRRICGWESARAVPDESVFSRSFAEFAETELPQRVHAALIAKTQSERLIGHISRDSTAIAVRERPVKAAHAAARPAKEAAAPATGQPSDKRRRPRQLTRIERQKEMTLEEMLAELPRHCSIGCKTNSQGRKETWRGYKLHWDVADGQIPISCLLTSASLHDSQAAIPLATLTAARVTSLYDLMDSAYDSDLIRKHSQELGHVPIIDSQGRRFKPARPMLPHEADRFRERTSVERATARLKDEFGGRNVRVRGALKVMAHLMFGILVLTVDQILRLSP